MDRRRFLALFGVGALGGVAGTELARSQMEGRPPEGSGQDGNAALEVETSGLERVVWSVDTDRRKVALTFDDGPDPEFTPRILDILDRHQVMATFMVMGYNAVRHPYLLAEVVSAGHEIGSHGWRHLSLAEASVEETVTEIERGTQMIEERAGVPIRVFRPPYGRFNEAAVRLLAKSRRDLIVWSVARGDLAWRDPSQVADHVITSLGPGEIIGLHDGIGRGTFNRSGQNAARLRRRREVELRALPRIIAGAKERDLSFETVSDLLTTWRSNVARA